MSESQKKELQYSCDCHWKKKTKELEKVIDWLTALLVANMDCGFCPIDHKCADIKPYRGIGKDSSKNLHIGKRVTCRGNWDKYISRTREKSDV